MKNVKVIVYFEETNEDLLHRPCLLTNSYNGDNEYHRYTFSCNAYTGYALKWIFQIIIDKNTVGEVEVCHVHP